MAFKDPDSLFFQSNRIRRLVIAGYCLFILAAVPLWWYTTSIERLSLPSTRVRALATKHLQIKVPLHIRTDDDSLALGIQSELEQVVSRNGDDWKDIVLDFTHGNTDSLTTGYSIEFNGQHPSLDGRTLRYPLNHQSPLQPQVTQIAETLAELLSPWSKQRDDHHRVVQFSPRYRLAFTLMDEDVSAGSAALEWDFKTAFKRHISPITHALSEIHNFTTESQVQYHGPLAFQPIEIADKAQKQGYALTPEQLTVFINSAEWTLSSSASNDPVLHFLLFIPSAARRPLYVQQEDNSIASTGAFILPQWGGIVIYNPPPKSPGGHFTLTPASLDPLFTIFSAQLHMLLGLPKLPPALPPLVQSKSKKAATSILSPWQLDAILRRRTLENVHTATDTLLNIVELVEEKIQNMPVGQDVRGDVEIALGALEKVFKSPSIASTPLSLSQLSSLAAFSHTHSSKAYFSPGMLAMLYFPAEHKYAIYTPLLASALLPLLFTVLREAKAWRATNAAKKAGSKEGEKRKSGEYNKACEIDRQSRSRSRNRNRNASGDSDADTNDPKSRCPEEYLENTTLGEEGAASETAARSTSVRNRGSKSRKYDISKTINESNTSNSGGGGDRKPTYSSQTYIGKGRGKGKGKGKKSQGPVPPSKFTSPLAPMTPTSGLVWYNGQFHDLDDDDDGIDYSSSSESDYAPSSKTLHRHPFISLSNPMSNDDDDEDDNGDDNGDGLARKLHLEESLSSGNSSNGNHGNRSGSGSSSSDSSSATSSSTITSPSTPLATPAESPPAPVPAMALPSRNGTEDPGVPHLGRSSTSSVATVAAHGGSQSQSGSVVGNGRGHGISKSQHGRLVIPSSTVPRPAAAAAAAIVGGGHGTSTLMVSALAPAKKKRKRAKKKRGNAKEGDVTAVPQARSVLVTTFRGEIPMRQAHTQAGEEGTGQRTVRPDGHDGVHTQGGSKEMEDQMRAQGKDGCCMM